MCGICGVIDFSGMTDATELVRRMTPTMRHRGPDDEGYLEGRSAKGEAQRADGEERLAAGAGDALRFAPGPLPSSIRTPQLAIPNSAVGPPATAGGSDALPFALTSLPPQSEISLALGMRRLSIIDLDGGHQPIYNEDRTVAVILNGEI